MALPATAADFEQGGLYGPTPYHEYPFFQERIDALRGRFAPNGQKLAIWGCGYGYLVNLAVQVGYDAFGFDVSSYAINKGKQLLPAISNRLFVRDALSAQDVANSRKDAGLKGNQKFALLVTEDLLSVLTDSEVTTAVGNLRVSALSNLLHIVSPLNPEDNQDPRLNWKTIPEWLAIVAPPDFVYDAETNRVWSATGEV